MSRVNLQTSKIACAGMVAGMLLMAVAGTMVVMSSPPLVEGRETEGARRLYDQSQALAQAQAQAAQDTKYAQDQYATAQTLANIKLPQTGGTTGTTGGFDIVATLKQQATAMFGGSAFQMCLGVLFAFLYHKQTVQKIIAKKGTLDGEKVENPHSDDFETGLFGCFDDKWVCIHGLFCPLVRLAHTNAVAGIMDFWPSLFAYFCCSIVTGGIGPCCLMVHWRSQLKHVMRIEDHCVNDILVTGCCPMLSICQQATAVDRYMGYEVSGCTDLEWNDDE